MDPASDGRNKAFLIRQLSRHFNVTKTAICSTVQPLRLPTMSKTLAAPFQLPIKWNQEAVLLFFPQLMANCRLTG